MINNVKSNFTRLIFFLIVIFLFLYLLVANVRVSMPLGLAFMITLIIRPLVPFFMKLGLSKFFSYIIIVTSILFITIVPIVKLVPKIKSEAQKVNAYIPKVEIFVNESYQKMRFWIKQKVSYDIGTRYLEEGMNWGERNLKNALFQVPNFLASILEWTFLTPLFVFFMLKDGKNVKHLLLKLVPNFIFERSYYVIYHFNKKLGDYVFAKFVEAFIVGLLITTGLLILDIKFAFLLGLVAAVTNILPYLGPILGTIPGVIVCMVEHDSGPVLFAVLMLYAVANIIDLAIVFPILVSKIVDLHPLVVVVSVILGSQYLGPLGMIVSIPLAAVLKLTFIEFYRALYPVLSKQDL